MDPDRLTRLILLLDSALELYQGLDGSLSASASRQRNALADLRARLVEDLAHALYDEHD